MLRFSNSRFSGLNKGDSSGTEGKVSGVSALFMTFEYDWPWSIILYKKEIISNLFLEISYPSTLRISQSQTKFIKNPKYTLKKAIKK